MTPHSLHSLKACRPNFPEMDAFGVLSSHLTLLFYMTHISRSPMNEELNTTARSSPVSEIAKHDFHDSTWILDQVVLDSTAQLSLTLGWRSSPPWAYTPERQERSHATQNKQSHCTRTYVARHSCAARYMSCACFSHTSAVEADRRRRDGVRTVARRIRT